ncbi:hypothetical protein [Parasutterella sp.]
MKEISFWFKVCPVDACRLTEALRPGLCFKFKPKETFQTSEGSCSFSILS